MATLSDEPAQLGQAAVRFVNTVAWRLRKEPREDLRTFDDWARWAGRAGLLSAAEVRSALRWGGRHKQDAGSLLERVIGLREALYRTLCAHLERRNTAPRDLALINEALGEANSATKLLARKSGFALECERTEDSRHALWSLARASAELLVSPRLELLRVCAAGDCGWLFLDESRNRRRRWCDMSDCGNREKARRYYSRHKAD